MTNKHTLATIVACCISVTLLSPLLAEQVDVTPHVAKLRAVGPKGAGHREAAASWQALSKAEPGQLTEILAGMKGAGRLSENWFRAVVEAVAQRHLKRGGDLPIATLEKFLGDVSQSPRARRLAYELIAGVDDAAESRLIPGLLDDPSLELRRDAIALALAEAAAFEESGKQSKAINAYKTAFSSARALDQIKAASSKLRELGQPANVPLHMGFVMQWHLIGPFDNTDQTGFDTVYAPEKRIGLEAKYAGKVGNVGWIKHVTKDEYGIVDLNLAFNRPKNGDTFELTDEHKGAVGYAYSSFSSKVERDVDVRIGCINANVVWLNGKLLTANHVYHAGMEVDQYVAQGRLKKGLNQILVKICQNEQEESWAQRWQFQLRVCDHLGTAVIAQNRPLDQTAAK